MAINHLNQPQNDFNRQRWEYPSRVPPYYKQKRKSEYISIPDYRKKYKKQYLIVQHKQRQQYQEIIPKRMTLSSIKSTMKNLKEDKELNRSNFNHFLDMIYIRRARIQFNSKMNFINYLQINPQILNNLSLEYQHLLRRYIILERNQMINFRGLNPRSFLKFCYLNISAKPIIKYESIEEPENFHIITKDDDNYFQSEESYNLFLKELKNVRYNKNLAKFYSKRNHKYKSRIK